MRGRQQTLSEIVSKQKAVADDPWPLEIGALWIYEILLRLCGFWWIIDRRERDSTDGSWDQARVAWVLGWLVALIIMWLINPTGILRQVFAVLVLFRLLEIFTTGLGTVLDRRQQARARSLITIGIYALQSAFIYAILEHSWASTAFVSGHTHAKTAFDFLYISWTDMTTLGNNIYTPANTIARVLQMLTATSGVLLLGVLLAFGINRISSKNQDD
jgi:Ion channel